MVSRQITRLRYSFASDAETCCGSRIVIVLQIQLRYIAQMRSKKWPLLLYLWRICFNETRKMQVNSIRVVRHDSRIRIM